MFFKQSRISDKDYLKFLGTMPCLVTGVNDGTVSAHHILTSGKRGIGLKSPDNYCVPLTNYSHMALHSNGNEKKWFEFFGIPNYIDISNRLYELYQDKDYEAMRQLILTRGKIND